MAKRKRKSTEPEHQTVDVEKLNAPDRRTYERIVGLADGVVKAADSAKDPALKIPARTLSNVKYNQKKRIIEMGEGKNERQLFNLNQAKSYMQTMWVASGCES